MATADIIAGRTTGGLREISGPSALGGDFRRFLSLTWTLAVLEFRLKFFGSVLGYFWQLMKPLMLFGVLYIVFTQFVRLGGEVKHYPALLLMGLMINFFFSEVTGMAVTSVIARENLVRKIHFPRLVIPASVVLTSLFNFVLNFFAVIVFILVQGVELRWSWLWLFPTLGLLILFTTGISLGLSALFVRYRDVQPIWDVMLPITFYGTPFLYPIESIPGEKLQQFMMCNPLAVIVQQIRHSVLDPTSQSAAEAIGGAPRLLIPLTIVLGVVVAGYVIFDRSAKHIAEEL